MIQPTPEQNAALKKINSTFAFHYPNAVHKMSGDKAVLDTSPDAQPPAVVCRIQDLSTEDFYASGSGENEFKALDDAIANAITAEKPMTKAQQGATASVDERIAKRDQEITAQREEIERLRKQLGHGKSANRGSGSTVLSSSGG